MTNGLSIRRAGTGEHKERRKRCDIVPVAAETKHVGRIGFHQPNIERCEDTAVLVHFQMCMFLYNV